MFKVQKASVPHLPDWLFKRPHLGHNSLTRGFLQEAQPQKVQDKPQPLGSFPTEIQECFLIEDLLHAMTSIEGVYIKRHNS
jgi:hypothetical protein